MTKRRSVNEAFTTISTQIEQAIRQDIINGVIAPGDRLRVAELSARYGASHIPVREALRQLEGDRLVVIESHKGAVLRGIDEKFVADIHDTRGALECLLIKNATLKATPEEIERMWQMAIDYETAAANGDREIMAAANIRLHRFIAAVADNQEAEHILEQGWELVINIRNRYGFGESRTSTVIEQHRRLVTAIAARDVPLALTVAQEHNDSARDDLLMQMRKAKMMEPAALK